MLVNPDGGVYVELVAPPIAAVYPSSDDRQVYEILSSPPLDETELPIVEAGVPPEQIVSPVVEIVPDVN